MRTKKYDKRKKEIKKTEEKHTGENMNKYKCWRKK
jgi:hypothetical protein